jgi:hypothetical protein
MVNEATKIFIRGLIFPIGHYAIPYRLPKPLKV